MIYFVIEHTPEVHLETTAYTNKKDAQPALEKAIKEHDETEESGMWSKKAVYCRGKLAQYQKGFLSKYKYNMLLLSNQPTRTKQNEMRNYHI